MSGPDLLKAQGAVQLCPPSAQCGLGVMEFRVSAVESAIEKIGVAVETIAKNTEQIARLEERHMDMRAAQDRAFSSIRELSAAMMTLKDTHDTRLKLIETALPGLKESSDIIKRGVLGLAAVVGLALVGMVVMVK